MTTPRVCIVILNWNGWQDTIECLRSLMNMTYPLYHIVLIDNGSTDDSIKNIIPHLNGRIHFICNKENLGFAKASNQGIEYAINKANAEYVWLLNNDTIVESNTLDLMVAEAKGHFTGMVQPLMLRMNDNRIIDSTGHIVSWGLVYDRGVGEINHSQYQDAAGLIGVSGAAGLYSAKMVRSLGMLDESYGTCFEDSEYSWRAYNTGWKTVYAPDAIVYHKRSESLNRMIKIDPKFAKQLYARAYRPCKTHGTSVQKAQFVVLMSWMAMKSYAGYLLGRNLVGASPYTTMIHEMIK